MSLISEDVLKAISVFSKLQPTKITDILSVVIRYYIYCEDKLIHTQEYNTLLEIEDSTPYLKAMAVAVTMLVKYPMPAKEIKKYLASLTPTIGESLTACLEAAITTHKEKIVQCLEKCKSIPSNTFTCMDWRLDVVLSSKLKECINTPKFMVQINTNDSKEMYECDYSIMKRIGEQLKMAKECIKNTYSKRVQRFAKLS